MILALGPLLVRPEPAHVQLARARAAARLDGRNVLVRFTAPWCAPCHAFERLLERPLVSKVVKDSYVVVDLTIDPEPQAAPEAVDLYNAWGRGRTGIPFYVVLSPGYRLLADSRAWSDWGRENRGGDPARFMEVLRATATHATAAELRAVRSEIGAGDAAKG